MTVSRLKGVMLSPVTSTAASRVIDDGALAGTVVIGWLDDERLNQILDTTNGNVVWSSANTDPFPSALGAVAGNFVVFPSVEVVRIEPYQ